MDPASEAPSLGLIERLERVCGDQENELSKTRATCNTRFRPYAVDTKVALHQRL